MSVVFTGSVQDRSTSAARDFVASVRLRLQMETYRHGERAKHLRSYQELERRIAPEELRRVWPHADIEAALGE